MLPLISLAAAAHTYTAKVGYLGAGGDVHPPMATTLADAEALCSSLANCSAFTFEGAASGQIAKVRAAPTLREQSRASERLSNPIVSLLRCGSSSTPMACLAIQDGQLTSGITSHHRPCYRTLALTHRAARQTSLGAMRRWLYLHASLTCYPV